MKPESSLIVHAFSTEIELAGGGRQLPAEIQWMPPGRNRIVAFKDGDRVKLNMNVSAHSAEVASGALREFRTRAAALQGDLPYGDFNHQDGEASLHPTDAYWGGDDPKTGGVRMKVDWTTPGGEGVLGKAWRRWSPSFVESADGEVLALPLNVGGLVNQAAFRGIQPVLSRDGTAAGADYGCDFLQLVAELEQREGIEHAVAVQRVAQANPEAVTGYGDWLVEESARKAAEAAKDPQLHPLVVQARDMAQRRGITTAAAVGELTRGNPALYESYRMAVLKAHT
jgi:hypothetical protein